MIFHGLFGGPVSIWRRHDDWRWPVGYRSCGRATRYSTFSPARWTLPLGKIGGSFPIISIQPSVFVASIKTVTTIEIPVPLSVTISVPLSFSIDQAFSLSFPVAVSVAIERTFSIQRSWIQRAVTVQGALSF